MTESATLTARETTRQRRNAAPKPRPGTLRLRGNYSDLGAGAPTANRTVAPDPTLAAATACQHVALMAFEILLGMRAVNQLATRVAPEVLGTVERRLIISGVTPGRNRSAERHRVRILRSRACRVGPDAVEVTVIVSVGERTRAAAARAETHRDGRWRVVHLTLG